MTTVRPTQPRHRRASASLAIALVGAPDDAAKVAPRLERDGHRVGTGRDALRRRQDVVLLLDGDLSAVRRTASAAILRARGARVGMVVGAPVPGDARRGPSSIRAAVRSADGLIATSRAALDHLAEEYGAAAEHVPPGATVRRHVPTDRLESIGLVPGLFHVVLAAPDDRRIATVVEGRDRSGARLPLVVVADGAAAARAVRASTDDHLVRVLTGADVRLREQLAAHALVAVHGADDATSGLLEPMGSGTAVIAFESLPNREVAGTAGLYFRDAEELADRFREVERYPFRFRDIGELMQERIRARHEWDVVAERYGALAVRLAAGFSSRDPRAVRRPDSPWAARTASPLPARTARPPG